MNKHIEDLRDKLHHNNWTILEELEGNDLNISGNWIIQHLYRPNKLTTLVFEGMGDLEVLPIEQSYACYLSENPSISLYFSKNNPVAWRENLNDFISKLNLCINSK